MPSVTTSECDPATVRASVKEPRRQFDYILLRRSNRWRMIETQVIDETMASDHRPIVATLELLPESGGPSWNR